MRRFVMLLVLGLLVGCGETKPSAPPNTDNKAKPVARTFDASPPGGYKQGE